MQNNRLFHSWMIHWLYHLIQMNYCLIFPVQCVDLHLCLLVNLHSHRKFIGIYWITMIILIKSEKLILWNVLFKFISSCRRGAFVVVVVVSSIICFSSCCSSTASIVSYLSSSLICLRCLKHLLFYSLSFRITHDE